MHRCLLFVLVIFNSYQYALSQNVGIGTSSPQARLHVSNGSVLFSSTGDVPVNPGNPPLQGEGRRFMWYPDKAAFRAGYTSGSDWDKDSIGIYSFASGLNTMAKGKSSIAMGEGAVSLFANCVAIGTNTSSSGFLSIALGAGANASGTGATALGFNTSASNSYATATGNNTTASGNYSTAMGAGTIASGYNATAAGFETVASGNFSTAMGLNANTNKKFYSFCIGGSYYLPTVNTADSQMMMRFSNYTFWVTPSSYAYLIPASNGWAYTSDKNKKERFEELNGETVLQKISGIPFYSWNFKDASVRQYRHYGITAQDFFNAFGKDSYGQIGNDTTVSPLDLLGVNMAAIKALEKRSASLIKENDQLKSDNVLLKKQLLELKDESAKLKTWIENKLALIEEKNKTSK